MRTFFTTLTSIHYNKWIITFRFNHHAMKIYKSYCIVRRKIFFYIITSFFNKKFSFFLLEIPSILNKFFITNDTCIVILIIYCFFLLAKNFLFSWLSKIFFVVSLPSKKFIQVFANHILCPCLPRSLRYQIGVVFKFFCF